MTKPIEIYDLLLDHCRERHTCIEEIIFGLTWTFCRAEGVGLAMSPTSSTRTLKWPGTLKGTRVTQITEWIRSWNFHEAAVGMAGVNSIINTGNMLLDEAQAVTFDAGKLPANLAVFQYFLPLIKNKKVAVVGRYPGLDRFADACELTVLERNPGIDDLPDTACEFVLPDAEWVFLTASSLVNKTFPRLVELSQNANLVLMGPSVPWLPELANFGIDFVAGINIIDEVQLRQTVAEGGGTRIFDEGVQYHIADLGLGEMFQVKKEIAELVALTESLKGDMEAWYAGPWRGIYPRVFELDATYKRLSRLDDRYKRLWDVRNSSSHCTEDPEGTRATN